MPGLSQGKSLKDLLAGLASVSAGHDRLVTGLALDSRRVKPGDLFLAVRGAGGHGSRFVPQAVAHGAVAVVQSAVVSEAELPGGVPVIYLPGLERWLGELANRYLGRPSADLRLVGVTGTNGKTSVCHFVAQALDAGGSPCGMMGTLGEGVWGRLQPALNTTPDVITVHRNCARWRDQGVAHGVMEVSSHGLVQGRVDGVTFHTAVFTNLGRDHLDYHGDVAGYAAAKRMLFELPGLGGAVLNLDDAEGSRLAAALAERMETLTFSLAGQAAADIRVTDSRFDAAGLALTIITPDGEVGVESALRGRFQAANLLAALGVLLRLGLSASEAAARLSRVNALAGRFEGFGGGDRPTAVVDYAHTPEALEHVLAEARALCAGRVTCVFGCGGERDPGKRPLMGAVAERLAQRVVITDDNPRGEDPERIVADIKAGLVVPEAVTVIRDRAAAIAEALAQAGPGDLVVVAGKGHEDYQEIAGRRQPFSDRQVVRELLAEGGP